MRETPPLLAGIDGGETESTARTEIERDPVTPDRNRMAIVNVANDNHITEVRIAA